MKNTFVKNTLTGCAILASALTLSACQSMQTDNTVSTQPVLKAEINTVTPDTVKSVQMGKMYLRPVENGIQVYGKLAGLTPGQTVAVHIHETGSCKNMGKAAGGHFNPTHKPHGAPNSPESHAGDMPNITADANGVATLNFLNDDISVNMTGTNSVYRRAIIVHSGVDDYVSQPSGDAGSRIGCGIIEKI